MPAYTELLHPIQRDTPPAHFANERRIAIQNKLRNLNLDAFLITDIPIIRWLTGFTGSNASVILNANDLWLITDGRYTEQLKNELLLGFGFISSEGLAHELKVDSVTNGRLATIHSIGFQSDKLSVSEFEKLKAATPQLEWNAQIGFFDEWVAAKSTVERDFIKAAVSITDKVFEKLLSLITPQMTELDLAAEISYWNKKYGGEKDSFDPIVASGARSALPHARATKQRLLPNEMIVIDMGTVYQGYCSDQTRTIVLGKASQKAREAYQNVLEAHLLGIASLEPNKTGEEIDSIVRNYFSTKGLDKFFTHSLGHSIGIQVHENPILGRNRKMTLPLGATVTIEPGLYFSGEFGIRIEDIVEVTAFGGDPYPKAPKHLIEL
ncbi:MAG: aminopeptidase P family protein [Chloroherpetonaceae bacterium]|nr:aminopeptidase P family protein [Chloroherpetonaceae bacterium]